MSGRWFRFYEDAVFDPKVQCLEPELFKFWVNMLCVCSKSSGSLPTIRHLSYSLRMQERKVDRLLGLLVDAGLIDRTDQGLEPHNWHGRQYKSDVSTERVKRFRERSSSVEETPSENRVQKTDTEQRDKKPAQARKTKLPDDWQPSEELLAYAAEQGCVDPKDTAERFRLHHQSKGTMGADWGRGFQYWCRNEKNFRRPESNGSRANTYPQAKTTRVDGDVEWSARLRGWYASRWWPPQLGWGPPPGEHGCLVPPHLLEKAAA